MTELHALLMETDDRPGIWSLYAWCSDIHQRAANWFRDRALQAFGRRRR
jgi:hypothetical protein